MEGPLSYLVLLYLSYIAVKYLFVIWILFRAYFLTTLGFVQDLKKYGEWAVITGATDGIGKEYAREFARKGFKIVLISRTKSKLEAVAKDITEEFNVEVEIVCFDFTRIDGYDEIERVISDLDVGVLVNNVGIASGSSGANFHDIDTKCLQDMVTCNILSDIRMTHMVSKGMVARKRGLILHISSITSFFDSAYLVIYPATKKFMEKAFNSLKLEYAGVVDHQLVTPGFVATPLMNKRAVFSIPTAEKFVQTAIRTIGIMDATCGYFSHEIICYILMMKPSLFYKWYCLPEILG